MDAQHSLSGDAGRGPQMLIVGQTIGRIPRGLSVRTIKKCPDRASASVSGHVRCGAQRVADRWRDLRIRIAHTPQIETQGNLMCPYSVSPDLTR